MRAFAFIAFSLVAGGLASAACSSLNPTPPNPHFIDDPELIGPAILDVGDAGHDAPEDGP